MKDRNGKIIALGDILTSGDHPRDPSYFIVGRLELIMGGDALITQLSSRNGFHLSATQYLSPFWAKLAYSVVTDESSKRSVYAEAFPNYCRSCGGRGIVSGNSQYGESPDTCPCQDCTEKGLCPRCGQPGLTSEERGDADTGSGPCKSCGWDYVIGSPFAI